VPAPATNSVEFTGGWLKIMSDIDVDLRSGVPQASAVKPQTGRVGELSFAISLILVGAILLGLFLSIMKLNAGTFIYTMDDPYITLAVSDQIRHGNYGVNPGIHAAASSSILFPALLALGSGTSVHPYLALILSCMALFATLAIVWRFLLYLRLGEDTFGQVVLAVSVLFLAVCMNLIGVVFTGAEHSLHIVATAACIYGLAIFLDEGRMPAWLPAVIVIAPLLRYEGLSLSIAAVLLIAWRGCWRTAAGCFALIVLFAGGFSLFLVSMGLPPLPSSVLTKSAVVSNGMNGAGLELLKTIGLNLLRMTFDRAGFPMLVIGVAAAVQCIRELPARPWRWTSHGLMALALACLIGGHAVAGRMVWFDDRYEDYALLGTAMMGIYLARERIRGMLSNRSQRLIYCCAIAVLLPVICWRYIWTTWRIPVAANNVYEQQFQMHRFIDEFYRGPVAVNDLGLVSYHNPNFVLDLGGLASEKARALRMENANADAYDELVESSGVHLVIIYDEFFKGQIPASWVKVASMDLSHERVSVAMKEVQFYATDVVTANKLRGELKLFRVSLPQGVKLTIYGDADSI